MENNEVEAREALAEVDRIREVNEHHLRRPKRYWIMFAAFFALWVLSPLLYAVVPEPYGYFLPVVLVAVVAAIFLWRKPRDMRIRYTLDETMLRQLMVGVVVPFVVLKVVSLGLFQLLGWWWVLPVAAVATFVIIYLRFGALDRQWAHTVSHRE
ncbi:hypothetical protein [Agrococcus casei]|uniref:Uncharacterized protein n=1 Tax=Agrococcus casei LMG 22410 TaxID=1255656 RepID=A0A1R4GKP5_9MICO|nr:hypothetical protein [Agrococcus casei]SJM68756.1 hypothetical protein CZ674_12755 [Agrococcus casei LMG 22410]